MTTTEPHPAAAPVRTLRRSRTQRVGAGVAGGLGEYFGLDPVLFRVLFATSAFFGGAGVIAYLLAWAAIPEDGATNAPIDGWMATLRRKRVPVWAVALAAGVLVWVIAFSWWAPGPFIPVLVVAIVLIVAFGRRETKAAPVDLTKPAAAGTPTDPTTPTTPHAGPAVSPPWVDTARDWVRESREASRRRRARALPVRLAVIGALVLSIVVLGVIDGVTGIALPVYFWTALGVVGGGLVLGMLLRRTPWSVAALLPPTVAGLIAFAGSHASLHDGTGQRDWRPGTAATQQFRLAFGEGTLDLRSVPASVRHIDITMASGQAKIVTSSRSRVSVHAHVRFGELEVDGLRVRAGVGLSHLVDPPAGSTGTAVTVDVHIEEGQVVVQHR